MKSSPSLAPFPSSFFFLVEGHPPQPTLYFDVSVFFFFLLVMAMLTRSVPKERLLNPLLCCAARLLVCALHQWDSETCPERACWSAPNNEAARLRIQECSSAGLMISAQFTSKWIGGKPLGFRRLLRQIGQPKTISRALEFFL